MLFDTITIKQVIGVNQYNEAIFGDPQLIQGRIVESTENIKNTFAEEVISHAKVYTVHKLSTNHYVNDRPVLRCDELKALVDGTVRLYRSFI